LVDNIRIKDTKLANGVFAINGVAGVTEVPKITEETKKVF